MTERRPRGARAAGIALALFGLLTVVAASLTWVEARAGDRVVARAGTAVGEGDITLVLGLALVVCGLVRAFGSVRGRALPAAALLLGALVVLVAGSVWADLGATMAGIDGLQSVGLRIGHGLWITVLAGVGAMWAAIVAWVRRA